MQFISIVTKDNYYSLLMEMINLLENKYLNFLTQYINQLKASAFIQII